MGGSHVLWVLAIVWGVLLGLLYFGGLWTTVRRLPGVSRPKTLLVSSFLVRLALVLAGMWWILQSDLVAFFLCLLSFFLVRVVMTRRFGPS